MLEFKKHQFANGLTVIAETNPSAHTSALGYFIKAGTRDEAEPVMGVSHFLEHMMFKGTDRRTADDVNREFDEIGANYNAFTSHEKTVYYAQVLPEFLPRAVDLISDMMRPSLRQEDFDVEKNVILEEIGMYDDRPEWRLHDTLIERYFNGHALGYRVLGTRQSIADLSAEQMRDYFNHRYSPDNMVVAASGRVDFDALLGDIEKRTSGWQATGVNRDYGDVPTHTGDHTMTDAKLNRHYVAALCPGPCAQDESRYAAKILADVLGDSDGSRLYWALVDPGLADDADFNFYPQDNVGCFMMFASCSTDKAQQVEKTLLGTIDQFGDDLTEDEVERAKNKIATLVTLNEESPTGRMMGLGAQWTYLKTYTPLKEELDRLMAVTVDDVKALVRETPFDQRMIVRLGPK